jgi:hypothetical protein
MLVNDMAELRLRMIDLLEGVRALLFEIEPELSLHSFERVLELRLRVDREIEALR